MKLEVKNMDIKIKNKVILEDINMEVNKNEFISILGPSGCGKSTLLKSIAGILEVDRGEIFIDSKNINKKPVHKRDTVIVFQDIRLFPHMTVYENISFPLKIKKINKNKTNNIVKSLLDRVKLKGFESRKAGELSGGQQQRVALARALAARPKILLLDEPFSGLDENLRFDMQLLIMDIHKEFDMTTIMVTHDKNEAISMSDRIMLMEAGRIIQVGKPMEVYNKPINLEVARYFGNASFIEGRIEDKIFYSEGLTIKADGREDGKYTLVLRNDSFNLVEGDNFLVEYQLNTNRGRELILKHREMDIQLKYRDINNEINRATSFDIKPIEERLVFLKDKD